jgi:hypothetical protein
MTCLHFNFSQILGHWRRWFKSTKSALCLNFKRDLFVQRFGQKVFYKNQRKRSKERKLLTIQKVLPNLKAWSPHLFFALVSTTISKGPNSFDFCPNWAYISKLYQVLTFTIVD